MLYNIEKLSFTELSFTEKRKMQNLSHGTAISALDNINKKQAKATKYFSKMFDVRNILRIAKCRKICYILIYVIL